MKVLLLSAYAAQSHRHWAASLQRLLADWDWEVLELPPRHFSWAVRGNPLYWSQARAETLARPRDLVVATSMVDLATLRGLVPRLAQVPAVLYFHENQFAYPPGRHRHGLLEAQMVSLYAALAACRLLFNSAYNRDSFLAGVDDLLRRLPDRVPAGVVQTLRARAAVLPVPCEIEALAAATEAWPGAPRRRVGDPLRLLWVGRFEHDKGVEALLAVARDLQHSGIDWELAVNGQQFRQVPDALDVLRREFGSRLVHVGYMPEEQRYHGLLRGADIVLSTALHEFQGLAVMEAVAAGCLPAVPDRLVYPELYPAGFRYAAGEGEAARLILRLREQLRAGTLAPPPLAAFAPHALAPRYRAALAAAVRQDSQ